MPDTIEHVAVVGTGTIGSSWAALFLAAGLKVNIYDPLADCEKTVRDYVARAWPALQKLGLAAKNSAGAISYHSNLRTAVKEASFVQESVPEQITVKHAVYAELEEHLRPTALVASSSSGLRLSDMQKGWRDPSRFFLAHPFNPPHLIPLIELQVNEKTKLGVLETAEKFYQRLGKVTIRLKKEVLGQVANRLQAALWREAIHLVVSGVVTVEDVDKAVWAGPGLRWAAMGPHMLFNLGAGQGGFQSFCERLGPSFEQWWKDLGKPEFTQDVIEKIISGINEESMGKTVDELMDQRDKSIISILLALRETASDSKPMKFYG